MSAWDTDNWGGGGGGASPAWDAGYPKNTKDYDAMAKQVEEDKETGQHVDHGFGQSFGDDGPAADNDGGNGGDDRTCYNCNQPGHNKAECPNPRIFTGECRVCKKEGHMSKDCPDAGPKRCGNCKEMGHFISECPKPLVCPRCGEEHMLKDCSIAAKCYHCGEEGHMAKECPTHVELCKNCLESGHRAVDCKVPRKVDRSHLPDLPGAEAWKCLDVAIRERDLDDVKEAVQIYIKALPETTYVDLEGALRNQGYKLYLIPREKPNMVATLTNMDFQGNMGKKYTVNYRFDNRPARPNERDGWPANQEEVMERLADAGEVVPRWVPKCGNCDELGHTAKECTQEKMERTDQVVIKCYNCEGEGHRVRDCPVPRVDKFACKNCGQLGHKVADCTEPRSAKDVECRKCGEMGHFSRDCPQGGGSSGCRNCGQEGHKAAECTEPRNLAMVQCRNCDEYGHMSKECPKPKDFSRIKCSNCQQMGHYKSKCPNPLVPEDEGGFGGGFGDSNDAAADSGGGAANSGGFAGGGEW